jgi:hypothetical protein
LIPSIVPPDLFINHGSNREMRWEAMKGQGYRTGIDRFFVRRRARSPGWRRVAMRMHPSRNLPE